VDVRVLVEPVRQQVVAAPVACVERGDPIQPLEIVLRIGGEAVVAQDDRVAAERYG